MLGVKMVLTSIPGDVTTPVFPKLFHNVIFNELSTFNHLKIFWGLIFYTSLLVNWLSARVSDWDSHFAKIHQYRLVIIWDSLWSAQLCLQWCRPVWASTHLNHSLDVCLSAGNIGFGIQSVIGYAPASLSQDRALLHRFYFVNPPKLGFHPVIVSRIYSMGCWC